MNFVNQVNFPRIEVYEYGIEGYGYDSYGYFSNLRKRKNNNTNNSIHVNPNEGMSTSIYYEYSKSIDPLIDATKDIYGELQNTKTKLKMRDFYKMYKTLVSRMKERHFVLFNQFYNLPKEELILRTIIRATKRQFIYLKNHFMKDVPNHLLNNKNRYDLFKQNIFSFKEYELMQTNGDYLHYGAFVYNIELEENEKVILFGDFHGSFHTFVRHLLRLHVLGVLDLSNGKYKINDGYKIVFLGDIVDRGFYGLEIIYILSKMILENNTKDKLKLILNRGNHENFEVYRMFGFQKEYYYKLKNISLLHLEKEDINLSPDFIIYSFFIYLPSAIILQKNDLKYWCSHGGIPLTNIIFSNVHSESGYELFEMENVEQVKNISQMRALDLNIVLNNRIIFIEENEQNIPKQIRWNDFSNNTETTYNFSRGANEFFNLGINHVKEFLALNSIQMIIRGHQDHYFNTWLLSKSEKARFNKAFLTSYNHLFEQNEDCVYNLSKIPILPTLHPSVKHFLYENNLEINRFLHKRPFDSIPSKVYLDGAISIVDASLNRWSTTEFEKRIDENNIFYPVLTISTNTDNDRPFTKDSFVLLRFDKPENRNRRNNLQSLFRKELFIHNLNNIFIYNNEHLNVNNNDLNALENENENVPQSVNHLNVNRPNSRLLNPSSSVLNESLTTHSSSHMNKSSANLSELKIVKKKEKPSYMKNTKSSVSKKKPSKQRY